MSRELLQSIARHAFKLAGFAVLVAVLLGAVYSLSEARIAEQRLEAERRALYEVLPPGQHDNDLLADSFLLDPAASTYNGQARLGLRAPARAYVARLEGSFHGLILPVTARDGYSGDINLLVGIRADGSISGVRVLSHAETPGLGDRIELRISDWILGFDGRSLQDPLPERWSVRRHAGDFDQFTGATVTPAAVVRALRNALQFFADNEKELLKL